MIPPLCFFPVLLDEVIGSQLDRKENKRENWQDFFFFSANHVSMVHSAFTYFVFLIYIFFSIKGLEFFKIKILLSPKQHIKGRHERTVSKLAPKKKQ